MAKRQSLFSAFAPKKSTVGVLLFLRYNTKQEHNLSTVGAQNTAQRTTNLHQVRTDNMFYINPRVGNTILSALAPDRQQFCL